MTSEISSFIFETGRFNFLWRLSPPNLILLTRESLQSGQIFRSKHIFIIPSLNNLLFQKQNSQTNISFYSCQICGKWKYLKLIWDRIFSYKTSISRNEQHHPYLIKRLTSWLKLKIRQTAGAFPHVVISVQESSLFVRLAVQTWTRVTRKGGSCDLSPVIDEPILAFKSNISFKSPNMLLS